jgi:selenoprotein W-related protein
VTGRPVKVRITYCAECGYEPQALELTKALMYEFGAQLSSIELIPWESGAFDVSVDGRLVHSMKRDGGFPERGVISGAVRAAAKAV